MSDLRQPTCVRRRADLILFGAVAIGVVVVMLIAASFARQTVDDLRAMETATSDNVQWTLPQVEVEFLALLFALEKQTAEGAPHLPAIRLRYDILYSRINTLAGSPVYRNLSQNPEFRDSLARVQGFIDAALPLIDGSDANLIAALPDLRQQAQTLRKSVRSLSVSGLSYFTVQTERSRMEIADTLARLAIVTGLLFLALTMISFFLYVMYRRTEAKSVELGQANQRMNTILSASLDGVIVADIQGRVQEFNSAAETIFGRSQAEAKNRTIGELFVPEHLRDAHEAGMKRLQSGGPRKVTGKGRVQLEGLRADGSIFPIEFALQSAFDGQQEIFIGFVRDISRRVQAQAELVDARDKALAGEKAKADFLTVMSHEIRTPLNGLLGNLSLLEDTALDPRQSEYIRNMDISGRILMGHVDAVLDISKFEAGRLEITREAVNLSDMIRDLVDAQRGAAETQGSSIDWTWVGPSLDWVKADPKRLQQVMLNLVGNAIKFTENGHISIELEVDPSTRQQDLQQIEIRVNDTGIGIADEDRDRVFEDFQTSDASFGRVTGGAGLGLGIARRLAQAMSGEIGVESTLGTGSTFWLRLPVERAAAPRTPHPHEDTPDTARALNVLIVEDNAINRQVAKSMLSKEGHSVSMAFDGKSGVDAAHQEVFDLILMDISMPVMDGMEATRRIRANGGPSADAPIIAVSANVLPQDQERYFEAGMDAFIGKPLTLKALRTALAAVHSGDIGSVSLPEQSDVLDRAQLHELRDNLGEDGFVGLVQRFVGESDAFIATLHWPNETAISFVSLADACHKAAGSASVFGARALREALISLQTAAQAEDRAGVLQNSQICTQIWQDTRSDLQESLPQTSPAQSA